MGPVPLKWLRLAGSMLVATVERWLHDQAPALAAALAYYTAFAISPLIFLITLLAGFFYADPGELLSSQFGRLVPGSGAEALQQLLIGVRQNHTTSVTSAVIGGVVLVFGASAVFGQLQDALNAIWAVTPAARPPLWNNLRQRLLSFAMLIGAAFLLLVSLVFSTGLAALLTYLHNHYDSIQVVWESFNFVASVLMTTPIFAIIFKVVPDAHIRWRDVWAGAVLTGVLFTLGQNILAHYLSGSSQFSIYGAFGSLIVLLAWVYYSAQIVLFGAEFTRECASRFGAPAAVNSKAPRVAPRRKRKLYLGAVSH